MILNGFHRFSMIFHGFQAQAFSMDFKICSRIPNELHVFLTNVVSACNKIVDVANVACNVHKTCNKTTDAKEILCYTKRRNCISKFNKHSNTKYQRIKATKHQVARRDARSALIKARCKNPMAWGVQRVRTEIISK